MEMFDSFMLLRIVWPWPAAGGVSNVGIVHGLCNTGTEPERNGTEPRSGIRSAESDSRTGTTTTTRFVTSPSKPQPHITMHDHDHVCRSQRSSTTSVSLHSTLSQISSIVCWHYHINTRTEANNNQLKGETPSLSVE